MQQHMQQPQQHQQQQHQQSSAAVGMIAGFPAGSMLMPPPPPPDPNAGVNWPSRHFLENLQVVDMLEQPASQVFAQAKVSRAP